MIKATCIAFLTFFLFSIKSYSQSHKATPVQPAERIGLNFIRPDVNRPGTYDFLHSGTWLVDQYVRMGLTWNRVAFSWVLLEPQQGVYNWAPYDTLVAYCSKKGIKILATIGGHFDDPAVPRWAGASLKEVIQRNGTVFKNFVRALVERYKQQVDYWEVLNEPYMFHKDLTVKEYTYEILRPCYTLIKSIDPTSKVLPCSYAHLPYKGDKEDFWKGANGYCDVFNLHVYSHWGYLRLHTDGAGELAFVEAFKQAMQKHGVGQQPFWITEIGWFGMAGIANNFYGFYNVLPDFSEPVDHREALQPFYKGAYILQHAVTRREDSLCAEWMKKLYPRLLQIPGCEKVFHWASMDEFEGGYKPEELYGSGTEETKAKKVDLWGVIGGDKKWRRSAFVLKELVAEGE